MASLKYFGEQLFATTRSKSFQTSTSISHGQCCSRVLILNPNGAGCWMLNSPIHTCITLHNSLALTLQKSLLSSNVQVIIGLPQPVWFWHSDGVHSFLLAFGNPFCCSRNHFFCLKSFSKAKWSLLVWAHRCSWKVQESSQPITCCNFSSFGTDYAEVYSTEFLKIFLKWLNPSYQL